MILNRLKILYNFQKTIFYRSLENTYAKIFSKFSIEINGLIQRGACIKRDGKEKSIDDFNEIFNWLMIEAKRGQTIQRYKGLGEMNPDQLSETTMSIETRRLLQVRIQDAVAADEIFTTLMSDHVKPRYEFINSNALQVANLDI